MQFGRTVLEPVALFGHCRERVAHHLVEELVLGVDLQEAQLAVLALGAGHVGERILLGGLALAPPGLVEVQMVEHGIAAPVHVILFVPNVGPALAHCTLANLQLASGLQLRVHQQNLAHVLGLGAVDVVAQLGLQAELGQQVDRVHDHLDAALEAVEVHE